ncbi:hypothetical protein U1Q18_013807 [Sarracenia purpurea var. burkii]
MANLDKWRNFFGSSHLNIFDILDKAILVAASDHPQEFNMRRKRIAKTLISPTLTRVESSSSVNKEEEAESQSTGKILTIKEVLDNSRHEPDSVVYDSLRKLQLMTLSMDILESTKIGRSVNALRMHRSKQICHLAKTLVKVWKENVDEWIKSTEAITSAEETNGNANPSVAETLISPTLTAVVDEEEALPCPPWDEGDIFVAMTTSIDLFKILNDDFVSDPQSSGKLKNTENERPSMGNQNVPDPKPKHLNKEQLGAVVKPNKCLKAESGSARHTKVDAIAKQKVMNDIKFQHKLHKTTNQKKPLTVSVTFLDVL